MKKVSIAEFRRNLSDYLDLVEEEFEIVRITNHNREIADIKPLKKNIKAAKNKNNQEKQK